MANPYCSCKLTRVQGGRNNGASSGVLKSTDGGSHWKIASTGIFDTRIVSLGIVDKNGDHVYAGTPGKIYETTDGAANWKLLNFTGGEIGTNPGTCYTFKNGTIGGEAHIIASCDCGIASIPTAGGEWSCAGPGGWGRAGYLTLSDADGKGALMKNSVLGGCPCRRRDCHFANTPSQSLLKRLLKGEGGAAEWRSRRQLDQPSLLAGVPNDHRHPRAQLLHSHPPTTHCSGSPTLICRDSSAAFCERGGRASCSVDRLFHRITIRGDQGHRVAL